MEGVKAVNSQPEKLYATARERKKRQWAVEGEGGGGGGGVRHNSPFRLPSLLNPGDI